MIIFGLFISLQPLANVRCLMCLLAAAAAATAAIPAEFICNVQCGNFSAALRWLPACQLV